MHRLPVQKGLLKLDELKRVLLEPSFLIRQMLFVVGLPKTIQCLFMLVHSVVVPGVQILG
jgi:hypothetical protein